MCKDNAHLEDVKAANAAGFRIQFNGGSCWYTGDKGSRWSFEEKPSDYRVHPDDVCKWEQYKAQKTCSNKPHVHAEFIKAWADGATIQYWSNDWYDCPHPKWEEQAKYRIKPEPTDLEKYGVEVGDVWRTKGCAYKIVGRKAGRDVYGAELDREILHTLLFRRGVVNKL